MIKGKILLYKKSMPRQKKAVCSVIFTHGKLEGSNIVESVRGGTQWVKN